MPGGSRPWEGRGNIRLHRPSWMATWSSSARWCTRSDCAAASAPKRLVYGRHELDRVVLTHFHDDHAGAAAEVGDWGKVTVMAYRREAPIIRGQVPGPPPVLTDDERELHAAIVGDGLPPAPPARVDRELEDGDVLAFGGGAHVLAVPGHTDGSIALYLPHSGVLFTGDNIAAGRNGQVILGLFNLNRYEATRSRLAALDSTSAVFGHGEPILTDAATVLREATSRLPSDHE
jgi:glyoxylase-like metal-dependent hydrolase (beta-lactamase superfamily II)